MLCVSLFTSFRLLIELKSSIDDIDDCEGRNDRQSVDAEDCEEQAQKYEIKPDGQTTGNRKVTEAGVEAALGVEPVVERLARFS